MDKTHYDYFKEKYKKYIDFLYLFKCNYKKIDNNIFDFKKIGDTIFTDDALKKAKMNKKLLVNPNIFFNQFCKCLPFVYFQWVHKKYFYITIELLELLKENKIDNISSKFIKLPFRFLYLNFPNDNFMHMGDNKTILTGAYLYEDIMIEDKLGIKFKDCYEIIIVCLNKSSYFGESSIIINPKLNINELFYFNVEVKNINKNNTKEYFLNEFIMFINIILYINTSNSNVKNAINGIPLNEFSNNKKINNLTKREKNNYKKMNNNHWIVDIPIKNHMSNNKESKSNNTNQIRFPFDVRGHLRNQPCGYKRKDSKLIWIEPFTKGTNDKNFMDEKHYKIG